MAEILRYVALLATGLVGVSSLLLAYRIWSGDKIAWERNRRLSGGLMRVMRGEVPTMADGGRTYQVSAGIAIDRKTRKWKPQGRLSDEAIASALRRAQ